jgi:tetratricopeptide (TPR) repeat protein
MLSRRMKARAHRVARCILAVACTVSAAQAQGVSRNAAGGRAPEISPDAAARARQHFQRGRELYQVGAYREAIDELQQAHELDPTAKDLVYNLAIVNEKLGQIDPALRFLHDYLEMELEPQERSRAEAMVKRLEGSKKEVLVAAPVPPVPLPPPESPPPAAAEHPAHGRLDAATLAVGGVAVAGFAVGALFGVKALVDRPSGTSGENGITPMSLQAEQSHAHTEGIVADVGFGVGVAALAITAYLYFGRTKSAAPPRSGTSWFFAPATTSGGKPSVLILGGRF